MKSVAIQIEYKGKSVISNWAEVNDEQLASLQTVCSSAASGKLNYLKIESQNKEYYFPKKIISRSIITIVHK